MRRTRLAAGTLEFEDGNLKRSKHEIGRVVQKFAKLTPADVAPATPKETHAQLRARLVAMPAWQYLETGILPAPAPSAKPKVRILSGGKMAS